LWFTNTVQNSLGQITTNGDITNYTSPDIQSPNGITNGPDGSLWFPDFSANSIGRISTSGVVTTYTDPTIDGSNAQAAFYFVAYGKEP
jgi:virginiamycin B lyase